MTEAELARDLHGVLEKVRQGAEVVVEQDAGPVAVLRAVARKGRTLSESIAIARQRDLERGYSVTLDPDFAEAVEDVVRNRKPWNPPPWD